MSDAFNLDDDFFDEDAFISHAKQAPNNAAKYSDKDKDFDPANFSFSVKKIRKTYIEPAPEPIPYVYKPCNKVLCAFDIETDPFKRGRNPVPFAVGIVIDDYEYREFWGGDDVIGDFMEYLLETRIHFAEQGKELVVYAHNGGKFDFNFISEYMDEDQTPFMIREKLVAMKCLHVEFRDSLPILPVPLKKLGSSKGRKLDIDINHLEADQREHYKKEILEYLQADCTTLLEAVREFIRRFGFRYTVSSVALPLLRSYHGFNCLSAEDDELIRPFYHGGRVQCFKTGILKQALIMVDANSMYAGAMANFKHPVSSSVLRFKNIDDERVAFVDLEAENDGCLGDGPELDFTRKSGRFLATIHEIRAGVDTGTLKIKRVNKAYGFNHWTTFKKYIDYCYNGRLEAKENGDELGDVFFKLLANGAYGKFAINPRHFSNYQVNPTVDPTPVCGPHAAFQNEDGQWITTRTPNGWVPTINLPGLTVWRRPSNQTRGLLNVATAASITGAARSVLWRAICSSEGVAYCDTDSIVCEQFNGDKDNKRLGAWKVEAEGDAICIGGKKMYAFLHTVQPPEFNPHKHERVLIDGTVYYSLKKAHKGVQLRAEQIVAICGGEVITHESDAPTYKDMGTRVVYQKRRIKMTHKDPVKEIKNQQLQLL